MVYYELIKVTINAPGQVKVIINVVVRLHRVLKSIVMDWDLLFISKFKSSLYYFLDIKRKLSTAFQPHKAGQIEKQNSMVEAYLKAFVNWEQDNWAILLAMAEFAYNNAKNTSTGHTLFKLNCGYHSKVFFKKDIDPHVRSRSTNKLANELRELMEVWC